MSTERKIISTTYRRWNSVMNFCSFLNKHKTFYKRNAFSLGLLNFCRILLNGLPQVLLKIILVTNFFYVLFTVHLIIILDNDQREAHLLYFTIHLLHSSTCFEHYMLIIRRLNFIDTASGIVLWKQVGCLGLLEYNLLHCL